MTALKYDSEKLSWHLLPVRATEGMLRGFQYGARKYTICGDCKAKVYKNPRLTDKGGDPDRKDCPDCKSTNLLSGEHNWRAGFGWSRLIGSTYRHLSAILRGEDFDPESDEPHVYHLSCCVYMLSEHITEGLGKDDRYKKTPPGSSTTKS